MQDSSNLEQEIRDHYRRMRTELATLEAFGSHKWSANSQYGYTLSLHDSRLEAEQAVIQYYLIRMILIRQ